MDSSSIEYQAYQRWYDQDLYMSAVAGALEGMSVDSQAMFADLLNELADESIARNGRDKFLAGLNDKILDGLKKARQKKRWYDQTPALAKAFNKMFAIQEDLRSNIAHQLFIPTQLVQKYELYCQDVKIQPEAQVIDNMLETCLNKGPEYALNLYGIYLDYFCAAA